MKTKAGTSAAVVDFPWIATLPEKQRVAVTQMMPWLATLMRESDEMTAGNVVIRMMEAQFAASKRPVPKAGLALALGWRVRKSSSRKAAAFPQMKPA